MGPSNLEKEQNWGFNKRDFRTSSKVSYQDSVVLVLRETDQTNRIYGQLIFIEGTKAIQWREDNLFNK